MEPCSVVTLVFGSLLVCLVILLNTKSPLASFLGVPVALIEEDGTVTSSFMNLRYSMA